MDAEREGKNSVLQILGKMLKGLSSVLDRSYHFTQILKFCPLPTAKSTNAKLTSVIIFGYGVWQNQSVLDN